MQRFSDAAVWNSLLLSVRSRSGFFERVLYKDLKAKTAFSIRIRQLTFTAIFYCPYVFCVIGAISNFQILTILEKFSADKNVKKTTRLIC